LPWLYNIPLRCCVASTVKNLFFAGRNISATHLAFASTRVMATCAAIGQGVGTAAAIAHAAKVEPATLAANQELLARIQQRLLRDDAYLVGVRHEDGEDLARSASVTSSSEQPGGEAQQILSGQTRAVHGPGKTLAESGNQWDKVLEEIETGRSDAAYTSAPPDRAFPGTHRWMSDPVKGLPAWIELRWPGVVAVSEIQLIFDTGMDRFLTLSQADGYTRRMRWGVPQPETVRDYRIEVATDAGATWREVVAVTGNYQRRRVHRLESAERVRAIRVQVMATNGLDHARIFEVRAYGPTVEDR
jgi:hypothetical protein